MEDRTYYIGQHGRWLHELHQRGLRATDRNHVLYNSIEKFLGLDREIKIVNVGPIDSTRKLVRELNAMGYKVLA